MVPEDYVLRTHAALLEQFARHQEQDLAMSRDIANNQKGVDERLQDVKLMMHELSVRLSAVEDISGKLRNVWQFAVILALTIGGAIQVLFYVLQLLRG